MNGSTRTHTEHWASEASSDTSSFTAVPTPSTSSNSSDTSSGVSVSGTASHDGQGQALPDAAVEGEAQSTESKEDTMPSLDEVNFFIFPASLTRHMGVTPCPTSASDIEAAEVLATDPAPTDASPSPSSSPEAALKPWADLTPSERRCRYLLRIPTTIFIFALSVLGIAMAYVAARLIWVLLGLLWVILVGLVMLPINIIVGACNAFWGFFEWIGSWLFTVETAEAAATATATATAVVVPGI
ncbi:uncharacterized protein BDZ99DRAFT_89162 [Mytilinidion resinicola]|uniref:Transmembrane protein n=1 Tax=Mytilinidion resinicola TaxID=574789 RepID=A0A6A6YEE2_9PEZI|nr:uncharacterized protein BDZ99DRAFT_89162 [Mytilinidion resinicola]KAF2806969.1 hypothetical protein BDZ99DRAFT_89162 [Mytilinidion resinicola]